MARLVPADEIDTHLSNAKGWLEDDDPFFDQSVRLWQIEQSMSPEF